MKTIERRSDDGSLSPVEDEPSVLDACFGKNDRGRDLRTISRLL